MRSAIYTTILVGSWLLAAGCGDEGSSSVTVSVSAPITTANGDGPSYLEKYVGQTISFEIQFDDYAVAGGTSTGCGETTLFTQLATRTASGPTSVDFTTEVLAPLPAWEITLEVCDNAASSSVVLVGVIDRLNTSFGCAVVPDALQHRDGDGLPHFQSFTASRCGAIILDVPVAFSVGNPDFEMSISTGSVIP